MKKVVVGLVLYGEKYLADSLPTLFAQDYPNIEYIFTDGEEGKHSAYNFIEKNLPEIFKKVKIIKTANLWHSGGHNAIINHAKDLDYYFCVSNDMLYPNNFVSKIVEALEKNKEFSFATCKSRKWDFAHDKKKTDILDSCGICISEHHHFYDLGEGEIDKGQYDNIKELLGVNGSMCAFTKEAIESVRYKDEFFDKLLHYKNDVDLSYRLQLAGNRGLFLPEIVVYHDRFMSADAKKPYWVKEQSLFGDKVILLKDLNEKFPLKIRLKAKVYMFLKTAFLLLTTPKLINVYSKLKENKAEILDKKKTLISQTKSLKNIINLMK